MSSIYPAIPAPTLDQQNQLRTLQAMKETVELMLGRRGTAGALVGSGSDSGGSTGPAVDSIARAAAASAQTAASTAAANASTAATNAAAAQADATLALRYIALSAINGGSA